MSKLTPFEVFIIVVEQGSITQAAEKLLLTKAAISKTIRNLEQHARIDFFDRSHRELKLTSVGELFYLHCKRVQKELVDARSFLDNFHKQPEGVIRVAVPSYFAAYYLYPHISAFKQAFPKLNIIIDSREELFDFYNDNIDIVCGYSVLPEDEEITQRKIGQTKYVLCASPTYLKKNGTPQKTDDLKAHIYVDHYLRARTNVTRDLKPLFKHYIEVTNTRELIEAALNHVGFSKIQYYAAQHYFKDKRLKEVLPEISEDDIPIYLYYKRHRYTQPRLRSFIDFFLAKNETLVFK